MHTLVHFLKNSGIFFIGSILGKLIAFIMLPLYTAKIPVAEFGYYDASIVYITLLAEVLFLNIWVVLLRQMYSEKDKLRPAVPALVLFFYSSLVYFAVIIIVGVTISPQYISLIAFVGFFQNISNFIKHIARGLGKNLDFAISGVIGAATLASVNYILLVPLERGVESIYIATICASLAEVLYLELKLKTTARLLNQFKTATGPMRPRTKAVLIIALPVGLNALVYWFINSANRVVVSATLGLEENGLFAIANRFGSLLMLVIMAMTLSWQDLAFSRSKEDMKFFGKAVSYYAGGLSLGVGLLLPAVSILFPYAVAKEYVASFSLIPLALTVAAFSGFSNFLVNIFYALNTNAVTFKALVISAIINLLALYPLIVSFGLPGALTSTIVGYAGGILVMLWILRNQYSMKVVLYPALVSIAFTALSVFVYFQRNFVLNVTQLAIECVAILLAAAGYLYSRKTIANRASTP